MKKLLILLFLFSFLFSKGQQAIVPIQMATKTSLFLQDYKKDRYFTIKTDSLIYQLMHDVTATQSMKTVIDNHWYRLLGGSGTSSVSYWTLDPDGSVRNTNTSGTVKIKNLPLYKHTPNYFVTAYDTGYNVLTKYPVSALINGDSIVNDTTGIDLSCSNLVVYSLADSTRWQHHPITNSNGDTIGCEWRDVSSLPIIPNYWTEDTTHKKFRIWVTDTRDSLVVGGYKPKAKFQVEGDMIVTNVPVGSRTPERMVVQDTVTGRFKRLPIPSSGVSSQWVTSGSDIYYSAGKVRVGANSGDSAMNVTGGLNVTRDALINGITIGKGKANDANNTAIGWHALANHLSGTHNVAVGYMVLGANTGIGNTGLGFQPLANNTSGGYNTGIGWEALSSNGSGSYNTAIGYNSGFYETRSNKLYLGSPRTNTNLGTDTTTTPIYINNSDLKGYWNQSLIIKDSLHIRKLSVKSGTADSVLRPDYTKGGVLSMQLAGGGSTYTATAPIYLSGTDIRLDTTKVLEWTELTYATLESRISAKTLNKGHKYLITDYQTVHTIPNTTDVNTGSTEPLIVTASTDSTLELIAYSSVYPQDVIYYNDSNDLTRVPGCTKGFIYRRIDTKQNNDIPFDFRNVKFRRWQINAPDWDVGTTYTRGNVVQKPTTAELYVSLVDGNMANSIPNTTYWRRFEWNNFSYVSWTETNWTIIDNAIQIIIPCTSLYDDYHLWASPTYYNTATSNTIGMPSGDLISYNNSVVFGGIFQFNNIGAYFYNNSIGAEFLYNDIGTEFNFNSIGTTFNFNIIGTYFSNNSIEKRFHSNTIDQFFQWNSLGDSFNYNKIGADFNINSVGTYFMNNNISPGFELNSIGSTFNNVSGVANGINFSQDTITNKTYSKNIFKVNNGNYRLSYIDSVSCTHIVNPETDVEYYNSCTDSTKRLFDSLTNIYTQAQVDGLLSGKAAINQTMYIGTTAEAINRASNSQTLTGVSIDGNAATATYITSIITIGGGVIDSTKQVLNGFNKIWCGEVSYNYTIDSLIFIGYGAACSMTIMVGYGVNPTAVPTLVVSAGTAVASVTAFTRVGGATLNNIAVPAGYGFSIWTSAKTTGCQGVSVIIKGHRT